MKKIYLTLVSAFALQSAFAQSNPCPYISGAMTNPLGVTQGTSQLEGQNEFVAFNTNGTAVNTNDIQLIYGTMVSSTDFAVYGTGNPSPWTNVLTPGLLTNSAGTITFVGAGATIPAGKSVVIIPFNVSLNYDLAAFGPDVYVLGYNTSAGSVFSYNQYGNFANGSSAPKYLKMYFNGGCGDTVNYTPDLVGTADGGGVIWDATGTPTYVNSGATGTVLPLELVSINGFERNGKAVLNLKYEADEYETVILEKSTNNGISYVDLATLPTNISSTQFTDESLNEGTSLYRLKLVKANGALFSSNLKISNSTVLSDIALYPNPATNSITIGQMKSFNQAAIYNTVGSLVQIVDLSNTNGTINIEKFPAGVYQMVLTNPQGQSVSKSFTKQ